MSMQMMEGNKTMGRMSLPVLIPVSIRRILTSVFRPKAGVSLSCSQTESSSDSFPETLEPVSGLAS